jgi:hypothetical protein
MSALPPQAHIQANAADHVSVMLAAQHQRLGGKKGLKEVVRKRTQLSMLSISGFGGLRHS